MPLGSILEVVSIRDPLEISLAGATLGMLTDVAAARKHLDNMRPFTSDVNARLQRALLPDRIVSSLNIEGIGATRRQTLAIMDAMRVRETKDPGQIEIQNALRADELVSDLVDRDVELSEQIPRELNAILLAGIRADAGVFRRIPVELPGAPIPPPAWTDVPDLMRQLVDGFALAESCDPILQACWLHAQFTMVHPFADGNGRTGRLLQDYALIRRGLLPVGVPVSRRDDYYAALADADGGRWDFLVETIGLLELDIIAKTERIALEPAAREAWIGELSGAAAKKDRDTRHKKYLLWRQCVEDVVREFCEAADELDRTSSVIGSRATAYQIADFSTWDEICRRGYVERTWLLSIDFFASGKQFYRLIVFLRRHQPHPYDLFESRRDLVGAYLTGVPAGEARPSFTEYRDPHIQLRELLFVDSNLYCYFERPREVTWECRDDYAIADIVRDLFKDVFNRKAGFGA